MKTRKKVLWCVIALILVAWIVFAWLFVNKQNKVKEYSVYCMDAVRAELWEDIGNIHMDDSFCSEWTCVYMWDISYEEVDYSYSCKVYNKENVELKLDPLYGDVCEWESCDVPGAPEEINEPEALNETEGNSLILVFSPTGNTKRMAEYISELTDIELTEIIPVVPYTEDDLNWRNEESRTFKEFKDNTIRPEIETQINIDDYDTIYLWFPIRFGITPNLILTLLENYDFSGKNIVLFCTSEHVGIEKAVEYLEPYNLNVIASHRFAQDTTKEQVQEWLESL